MSAPHLPRTRFPGPAQRRMTSVLGPRLSVSLLLLCAASGCTGQPPTPDPPARASGADESSAALRLFEDVTGVSGVDSVHLCGRAGTYFFPEIMAPGGAVLDFDNDGDLDLLLVGAPLDDDRRQLVSDVGAAPPPTLGKRLYRQDEGGRFTDVTAGSGLENSGFAMGVAAGDVNNDGRVDVYVTCYGPDRLYLNRGDGTFADVTQAAGIDNIRWAASACFVDYDRDGWLDLFVTNYVDYFETTDCVSVIGEPDYCSPDVFHGTADVLYRNETGAAGSGESVRFRDASLTSGIGLERGPGLGVLPADFNDDGWIDLYVANDGTANFLWINRQDGTFRNEAILRGCAVSETGIPQASMGTAWGDADGDGRFDLFLTHLDGEYNALYNGRDPHSFRDTIIAAGLAEPGLASTGFGTAFVDFDHDGDLDLAVVNGRVKRAPPGRKPAPVGRTSSPSELSRGAPTADAGPSGSSAAFWQTYAEPNHLFLNDGAGRFAPVSPGVDPYLAAVDVSRGLLVGDLDNDGDCDVIVTNTGGPARLYRNVARKSGSWLIVRAVEPKLGGRDACGALVTVVSGARRWRRLVQPAYGYLTSNDPRVHFGLGAVDAIDRIEVRWPDGGDEVFDGGTVNSMRVLAHGGGQSP